MKFYRHKKECHEKVPKKSKPTEYEVSKNTFATRSSLNKQERGSIIKNNNMDLRYIV